MLTFKFFLNIKAMLCNVQKMIFERNMFILYILDIHNTFYSTIHFAVHIIKKNKCSCELSDTNSCIV